MMLDLHEASAMVIIPTLPNACDRRISSPATRTVGPCQPLEETGN
jgi:hypothetical protein